MELRKERRKWQIKQLSTEYTLQLNKALCLQSKSFIN